MTFFNDYVQHSYVDENTIAIEMEDGLKAILNPETLKTSSKFTEFTIFKSKVLQIRTVDSEDVILDPISMSEISLPGCERVEELDEDKASLKIYSTAGSWAKLTLSKNEFVLSAYQFDE